MNAFKTGLRPHIEQRTNCLVCFAKSIDVIRVDRPAADLAGDLLKEVADRLACDLLQCIERWI